MSVNVYSNIDSVREKAFTTDPITYPKTKAIISSDSIEDDMIKDDIVEDIEDEEIYDELDIFEDNEDIQSIITEGYSYLHKDMGSVVHVDTPAIEFEKLSISRDDLQNIDDAIRKDLSGKDDEYPLSTNKVEKVILERALTPTKRNKLKDSEFGLPRLRKFPLNDRAHVNQAIRFFNVLDNDDDRKELADNIIRRYSELNLSTKISKTNKLYNFVPDNMKVIPLHESSGFGKSITGSKTNSKTVKVSNKIYVPVYVLLTANKTAMGDAIRKVTSETFNHASISFDNTLNRIFSFNVNGFVVESVKSGRLSELAETGTKYSLYVTFIAKDKAKKIEDAIVSIMNKMKDTSYNFTGLFKYLLNIPSKKYNEYHQFCSEFVTNMLQLADETLVKTKASLTSPEKVVQGSDKFYHLSTGLLKEYSSKDTINELKKIIKSNRVVKYLVENSIFYNNIFYNPDFSKYIKTIREFEFFNIFYPCVKFGLYNQMRLSIGGLYYEELSDNLLNEDGGDSLISSMYNKSHNRFGVDTTVNGELDIAHIKYCIKLYHIVEKILSDNWSGKLSELTDSDINILLDWRQSVEYHLSLYHDPLSDATSSSVHKQYLFDLLWDPEDDINSETIIANNIIGFCKELNIYKPLNECLDMITPEDTYMYIRKNVLLDDMYYLIPDEMMYPIFDRYGVNVAMSIVDSIEKEYVGEYVKRLNYFYKAFNCNFTIPADHPFAKYDTNNITLPIRSLNEFASNHQASVGTYIGNSNYLYSDYYTGESASIENLEDMFEKSYKNTVEAFSKLLKSGEKL